MKISRNEEANFPNFSSHDEARDFFKNAYGERFVMTGSEMIADMKVYFYYLILDPEIFADGQKKLQQGHSVSGLEYLNSHQPIEIFEDGRVHVIH